MTALSYRDYQNAQHALSQAPPAVPFSAPSDVFAARFESGMFMGSAGRNLAAREATNRFASWYEERTGQRYPEVAQKVRDEIALATGSSLNYQPATIPDLYSPEVADAVRQKYLSENPLPALRDVPPPAGAVADDIARTSEEVANELSERAGTLGETFGLVGDLASGMLSPETLATMLFTPVGVATVGGRAILQIAGREAAFGAGFEVPAQVAIQTRREELGFDAGFWQGAMNVAVVGGLSGVLGGVIRGVVEARNAIRANRTVPGSAARRLYEDLSPDAQRTLEDTSFDVRAVADVVTREFETNARFRNRLRTAEREAIERAIQVRNNMLPFQPRSPAEVEAVDAAIRDVGASLETGLPFRPDTLRAAGDTLPVVPRRAPEVPEALKEHAPDEVKEAVRALEAGPPPAARAPAEQRPLRFSKGQKEQFDKLLRQEGRTEAEARAAIDVGEVSTGARGQITKKSIDELRDAFVRLPRNLPPVTRPDRTTPPPRTVADLQGRPADLPPGDATAVRLSDDELEAIRRMTDAQRADEAEASLRARAGLPEAEAQGAVLPPFLQGVKLDDLNYTNGLKEIADQAGVTAGPGISRLDVIAQIKAKYAEAFKPKPYDFRGYRDTRQEGVFYHGSPDVIESLAEYSYASTNYYGQGFYTSNAIDVIHGYALRRGAARGTAYRVSEKAPVKFYDMEAPLTREQANELRGRGSDLVDDALSERPANLRELYDTMRDISVGRRIPADEVQDDFAAITRGLEEQGFGGMQHTGGLRTNVAEHTVRIYFSPREQLDLAEVSLADFRAPARSPAPDGPRPDPASPATLAAQAVVRDIDTLKAIEAAVEGCRFG